ncbi:PREDICTED: coiled-coil domain-containing protein 113-like [Dufourea novaeangliae]|uniref:coiled-coil domain-containing protein 113-like n=1 Tax=Dufourea novaeangliae TaxID=178035 RepID=UPI000766F4B6|nr:PREDICTED: coiled-coil domain-containing protein 113-like [Dufourea novaeangliae]
MSFRDSIAFLPDPARRKTLSSRASVYSVLSLVSGSRMGTSSVSTVGKCTEHSKITITHRITMAYKEVEEMTKKLSEEKSLAKKRKAQIRAEIEEVEIRITEVHEAKVEFEENVVVKGVDRITGKIPAEKVTRFIEEWLRSANTIIGRLRLRSSTLKMLIKKTRQQLAQREELGEALRAVDFEQLNIQNKDYIRMIEEKTIYVLDMKRIAGHYHLKLTQHKQKLSDLLCTLNGLKNDISLKQEQINELEDEHKQVETEVAHLNKELEELLHYMDNYTVPDILDFVKLEIQVQELQKKYKLLDRRKNIQKIIFRTSRKQGHNQKSVQDIIMHKKISGTIYPIAPFTVNSLTSHTHTN